MAIWQGEHVRLRAVEPEDWQAFAAWNADDEMAHRLYFIPFPLSHEATQQQVARYATERPDNDTFRFMIETMEAVAGGGIATHRCDRRVGSFAYGLNVLPEHRGRGYATEAVRLVLRYYFRELRYQKCTVEVYDFNDASIRLHERLGFQREGRLRRMGYSNGRHFDVLMYGITAEEYERSVNP